MRVGIRRLAAGMVLAVATSMLPLSSMAAHAAPTAHPAKLKHVSFSTTVKQGRTYLQVKANLSHLPAKQRLTVYSLNPKRKLSSCTIISKCNVYVSSRITNVMASTQAYHSQKFSIKLTKVSLASVKHNGKRYLQVKANVATVPAKTPLRVYDAASKKRLVQCTTVAKCNVALPETTSRVYAVAGKYRSATTTLLGAATPGFTYKGFENLKLTVQSETIQPPAYLTPHRENGENRAKITLAPGVPASANNGALVSTGTDVLTVTGLPDYARMRELGLALYIFEVNDRDATIAGETDDGDGHLFYPSDAHGNPTFTLYAWRGSHTHTYVAAIAGENRPPDVAVATSSTADRQPTFAQFMANHAEYGDALLSNPVTVKPNNKALGAWIIDAYNQPGDERIAWVKTNYTEFENVAQSQLLTQSLLGELPRASSFWGDLYQNPSDAAARYQELWGENIPGFYLDPIANPNAGFSIAMNEGYADRDATWDYKIRYQIGDDPRWHDQWIADNADPTYDAYGNLDSNGVGLEQRVRFVVARWSGNTPYDVLFSRSISADPSHVFTTPKPTCDPATQTDPVQGEWNFDQSRYAMTDVLTGGALSELDSTLDTGMVNRCSLEYKVGNAATSSALVTLAPSYRYTGLLDDTVEEMAGKVSLAKGLTKLANPETRTEGANEIVKDYLLEASLASLRGKGCVRLANWYAVHPTEGQGGIAKCSAKAEE